MGWGLKLVRNLARPAQSLAPRVDMGMAVIRSTGGQAAQPHCFQVSCSRKTSVKGTFLLSPKGEDAGVQRGRGQAGGLERSSSAPLSSASFQDTHH